MEDLILRALNHALSTQTLQNFLQHFLLDFMSDVIARVLKESLLFFFREIGRYLDVIWETYQESSRGVEGDLALQIIDPMLEGHHLSNRCLKVDIWTGGCIVKIYHRLLTLYLLRE